MKKVLRALLAALPHATLVLSLMMLILFTIDRFNEAMAFLNNDLTKWILAVFCFLTLCLSVLTVLRDEARRKRERRGKEGDEHERTK